MRAGTSLDKLSNSDSELDYSNSKVANLCLMAHGGELALISLHFLLVNSRFITVGDGLRDRFITVGDGLRDRFITVGDGLRDDAVFDVTHYGAAGDGFTDDTQAFRHAWEDTCNSMGSPTMLVPLGRTFLLHSVVFDGKNCNSNHITVLINGNLIAPSEPSKWKCTKKKCPQWIAFAHMNGLYLQGSGIINGQGAKWWALSCNLKHLTFEDSPQMHIALESSTWVFISHLSIRAPGNSPNTDGIHIQESQNVYIQQSSIGTGDDCISIGSGSAYLNINQILCGPGHGISIGSLGKKGSYETVEFVNVSDVLFTETTNGVRIKTWQGGSGYARNIGFERIISQGSTLPIVIDQFYCDHTHCTNQTTAVQVSDITYNQIKGTSRKPMAVKIACSGDLPCTNILMQDVSIESTDDGRTTSSYCLNAQGRQIGIASPNVPCLMHY
ncbi:probable polygalacturonase At1g80170 [Malania oleifera]|uniref:probable polygalacturonase At1g80170 n=1 Tax=Malania oleifera TaxID=397392 RepID=UPI0025AE36C5|nr:probable polygalacturonase At1g80170 [Malania oleifera]